HLVGHRWDRTELLFGRNIWPGNYSPPNCRSGKDPGCSRIGSDVYGCEKIIFGSEMLLAYVENVVHHLWKGPVPFVNVVINVRQIYEALSNGCIFNAPDLVRVFSNHLYLEADRVVSDSDWITSHRPRVRFYAE